MSRSALLAAILLCIALPPLGAVEAATDEAGEIREILADRAPPWYDAEADSWRRVAPEEQDETWSMDSEVDGGGGITAGFAQLLMIALIAGLIALLALLIVYLVQMRGAGRARQAAAPSRSRAGKARLGELPAGLDAGDLDWERELEAARRAGDARRVVIAAYAASLLRLDQTRCILLRRGTTNRGYLRELRGRLGAEVQAELLQAFDALVREFERLYFGGHPAEAATADACWEHAERIARHCRETAP